MSCVHYLQAAMLAANPGAAATAMDAVLSARGGGGGSGMAAQQASDAEGLAAGNRNSRNGRQLYPRKAEASGKL